MKTFITILLITSAFSLPAQTSWVPPGAVWHYSVYTGGFPLISGVNTFSYTGDTAFGAINCKIISKRFQGINQWVDMNNTISENFTPYYYTYQSNGVTLIRNSDGSKFDTIANFNATIGNQWLLVSQANPGNCSTSTVVPHVEVKDTGHVTINGFYLKRIVTGFTLNAVSYTDTLTERIGSRTFFWYPENCLPVDAVGNGTFNCYQDNTFPLYKKAGLNVCDYPVGINELKINNAELNIYPNPASDKLKIEIQNQESTERFKNGGIQLLNSLGQVVKQISVNEQITNSRQLKLNVSDLPEGFYTLNIKTKDNLGINKAFVIAR